MEQLRGSVQEGGQVRPGAADAARQAGLVTESAVDAFPQLKCEAESFFVAGETQCVRGTDFGADAASRACIGYMQLCNVQVMRQGLGSFPREAFRAAFSSEQCSQSVVQSLACTVLFRRFGAGAF